jgi:hypothetical protein
MAEELNPPRRTRWLDARTAARMLGIGVQHTYRLAREEKWRSRLGTRPREWSIDDIHRTWKALKKTDHTEETD